MLAINKRQRFLKRRHTLHRLQSARNLRQEHGLAATAVPLSEDALLGAFFDFVALERVGPV